MWYAADQDYGIKHSVFAPFFGIETATITMTGRLADKNKSAVLMLHQFRNLDSKTWTLKFSPILTDFPSGDDKADATRLNAMLEAELRAVPAQYLWMHRRFKTRPAGEESFYL
jgi:KDO2-lipid IV(A) lauroyltransferase